MESTLEPNEPYVQLYSRVLGRAVFSYSMVVVLVYLTVIYLARRLKRLFNPLDLRNALILHNIVCVALSAISLYLLVLGQWREGTMLKINKSNDTLRYGLWVYWISKYYELLDTIFMLLRHRLRQVSFLHVFHHASMAIISDYAYNYAAWPPLAFSLSINSFIHIVMYGYYCLTAFYPLESFSWKKRVTQMQLIQFCIGVGVTLYGYRYEGYCFYSIMYPAVLMVLFANYYRHAFLSAQPQKKQS